MVNFAAILMAYTYQHQKPSMYGVDDKIKPFNGFYLPSSNSRLVTFYCLG